MKATYRTTFAQERGAETRCITKAYEPAATLRKALAAGVPAQQYRMGSTQSTSLGVPQPPPARHVSVTAQQAAGNPVQHVPTSGTVSADTFLQATTVAWGHLEPKERKAIRAACRAGRTQHDRLLTHLCLTLGTDTEQRGDPSQDPDRLRASLQAVLGQCAPPRSLSLSFMDPRAKGREDQMLAVLDACSGCPLTSLELSGSVPLTPATAQAIDARCPQLHSLCITQTAHRQYNVEDNSEEAEKEYLSGCQELLIRCGPRLRSLKLRGLLGWDEQCFMAVRHCTALTELDLDVEWMRAERGTSSTAVHIVDDLWEMEPIVYRATAQLKTLQSLRICTESDMGDGYPGNVLPLARCVTHLSALTGLTRLHLERSEWYEHCGFSIVHNPGEGGWDDDEEDDGADEGINMKWDKVVAAHRTSVLSVLHALPQLQDLHCPTLWLRPLEAGSLTALTSLTLGGLLLPQVYDHAVNPARSIALACTAAAASGTLPPRLQELSLESCGGGISPRMLTLLRLPTSLTRLTVRNLSFYNAWDLDRHKQQLLPEALSSVGTAVQLLTALRPDRDPPRNGRDGAAGTQGTAVAFLSKRPLVGGHRELIRRLQGLDAAYGHLTLRYMKLSAEDLCCLAQTLPSLKGLSLKGCSYPLEALPAMQARMPQLQRLDLDVHQFIPVNRRALVSLLVQLCRPQQQGAMQLRELDCRGCGRKFDTEACRQAVLQRLEREYGVTDVAIEVHQYPVVIQRGAWHLGWS